MTKVLILKNQDISREEFAVIHAKVCNKSKRHRKGMGWNLSPSTKRWCGRNLYDYCKKQGIPLVAHARDASLLIKQKAAQQ